MSKAAGVVQCSVMTRRGTRCQYVIGKGKVCPYHGEDKSIDATLGEGPNIPDADSQDDVNAWLRKMAIEALAAHYRNTHGQIDHNVYKTYQTTLEKLFKEVARSTPDADPNDVVAMVRGELDAVFERK